MRKLWESHPRQWVDRSNPPTRQTGPLFVSSPSFPSRSEGKEGEENVESGAPVCRLSLNNPPTAVGGISDFLHSLCRGLDSETNGRAAFVCRLGLNDRPTAREWDSRSFHTVSIVGGIQSRIQLHPFCLLDSAFLAPPDFADLVLRPC